MFHKEQRTPEVPRTEMAASRIAEVQHALYGAKMSLLSNATGRNAVYEAAQEGDTHALYYYPNAQQPQVESPMSPVPADWKEASPENMSLSQWQGNVGSAALSSEAR